MSEDFLDHPTKRAIARHGTDAHRSILLKNHTLDDKTKRTIISRGTADHISDIIKNHSMDRFVKNEIIHHSNATDNHRTELIKNHHLDDHLKSMVASRSVALSIQVLDNPKQHPLDHLTYKAILSHKDQDLSDHLLAHHPVPDYIKATGTDVHRDELMKKKDLNDETIGAMATHGNSTHHKHLLDTYKDLTSTVKDTIARAGKPSATHLVNSGHPIDDQTAGTILNYKDSQLSKQLLSKHKVKPQILAAYGDRKLKGKMLKEPKINHKAKRKIAETGTVDQVEKLVNEHPLDDSTRYMAAIRGNERTHHQIIKKYPTLDQPTKDALMSKGSKSVKTELLKNHTVRPFVLAQHGFDHHRAELLKGPLDGETKSSIASAANHKHLTEFLKNHKMSDNCLGTVARRGTDAHRDYIIKHHKSKIDGYTLEMLGAHGNKEHKQFVLNHSKTSPWTAERVRNGE